MNRIDTPNLKAATAAGYLDLNTGKLVFPKAPTVHFANELGNPACRPDVKAETSGKPEDVTCGRCRRRGDFKAAFDKVEAEGAEALALSKEAEAITEVAAKAGVTLTEDVAVEAAKLSLAEIAADPTSALAPVAAAMLADGRQPADEVLAAEDASKDADLADQAYAAANPIDAPEVRAAAKRAKAPKAAAKGKPGPKPGAKAPEVKVHRDMSNVYFKQRRNRVTGTLVTVETAEHRGADVGQYKWVVTCEDHGTHIGVPTRNSGIATSPLDFCDPCREHVKELKKAAAKEATKKAKAAAAK